MQAHQRVQVDAVHIRQQRRADGAGIVHQDGGPPPLRRHQRRIVRRRGTQQIHLHAYAGARASSVAGVHGPVTRRGARLASSASAMARPIPALPPVSSAVSMRCSTARPGLYPAWARTVDRAGLHGRPPRRNTPQSSQAPAAPGPTCCGTLRADGSKLWHTVRLTASSSPGSSTPARLSSGTGPTGRRGIPRAAGYWPAPHSHAVLAAPRAPPPPASIHREHRGGAAHAASTAAAVQTPRS